MSNLIIRTEDIRTEYILDLYVETSQDRKTVELLKAHSPAILEGSRGTGKSFLLRVAEAQLLESFPDERILPVYLSFSKSSLLQSGDNNQFINWMMARLCGKIVKSLYRTGLLAGSNSSLSLLAGEQTSLELGETRLERIAKAYEETYRSPGAIVDNSGIPSVEDFKDAIEDICHERDISRLAILFDEAAHIFRPEQQRQFFTLFRDLRSPYVSCNAAVYPGVTFFGETFQTIHDANQLTLIRDPQEKGYLDGMREIVLKQADSDLIAEIERHRENFNALAYAVSGNPRLLLKTVGMCPKLRATEVKSILKEFYRTDVWSEHSALAERYAGHRALIDWGREFIEKTVIPDAIQKNEQWAQGDKTDSTCFFWIHRDAPLAVKEALRMLSYTGIVTQLDTGIVATRREIGTRYAVNLGCLAAPYADPIRALTQFGRSLSVKRFSEYGANHPIFSKLTSVVGDFHEFDISQVLALELAKPIDVLDLTTYQKNGLRSIGLDTIGKALQASEPDFQTISYIGPKRSRKIMNVVTASVLEYLSG